MIIEIKRGRKYREGHGLGRSWYYYECSCDDEPHWYLNEDAMKDASLTHARSHNE